MEQPFLEWTQHDCEKLVAAMEQHLGRPLDGRIRKAFCSVPRHPFVPQYYEQQGTMLKWNLILEPSLDAIYQDEPLVTKIDGQGRPMCSSSLPSIMAQQLESLQLSGCCRVLEIGTGTGYNAAVMGHLLQSCGQVLSIDIDRDLVHEARSHLKAVGIENVLALHGDGFTGLPNEGPYDRLLATCGIPRIPRSWFAQLAQGGKLIANVLLPLASIFVCLEKIEETTVSGNLLPIEAIYMEMRSAAGMSPFQRPDWPRIDALPHRTVSLNVNLLDLLQQSTYCLLLQSLCPALEDRFRWIREQNTTVRYLFDPTTYDMAIALHPDHLIIYGTDPQIETQIRQSLDHYYRLGCPTIADCKLRVDETGAFLFVGEEVFPLSI